MSPHSIAIIGGAGFVGSNLALRFKRDYPDCRVVVFDSLKRRGSELNLNRFKEAGIEFLHGDVRIKEDFEEMGAVEYVIDAAAEPSVLAGLEGQTDYVLHTNLVGTINCLHFAHKHRAKVVFLSTSRVYPFGLIDQLNYTEEESRFALSQQQSIPGVSHRGLTTDFPLTGAKSFYGASKLASELLITEFTEFTGLQAIINRCGVITGPWQMGKIDQGVIVLWMARHLWKMPLTYNGYGGLGKQVRDILHVDDLYRLIKGQLQSIATLKGKVFNVGGGLDCSVSLVELTHLCREITGNRVNVEPIAATRKADVRIYLTDNKDVEELCNWNRLHTPESILTEIFQWLKEQESLLKPILI